MQLTQFTDYGLRSLIYLASQPERLSSVKEIAEFFGISRNHLVKVIYKLAQLGYITSSKGRGGGIRLAGEAKELRLGELIKQLETHMNLVECFDKKSNTCHIISFCKLRGYLHAANTAFINTLDNYTLADTVINTVLKTPRIKEMITIKRVYDEIAKQDGERILIDKLWPRGLKKEEAAIDLWLKEIAPSTDLRKWFNHSPTKWKEFKSRYHKELADKTDIINMLLEKCHNKTITLLYGAKDEKHNHALALAEYLKKTKDISHP